MIYEWGGVRYNVSLERLGDGSYRATIDGRSQIVNVTALPAGWLLEIDGVQQRAFTAAKGDLRWVSVGSDTTLLTQIGAESAPNRQRRLVSDNELKAQMPGQVIEIAVKNGGAVARGQTLLILEAMKMEIRVSAPADGRVKRLLVKMGDVVERGQKLIEME